jgi:predicted transcriptional regulator
MTRHVTIELTDAQAAMLDSTAAREATSVEAVVSDLINQRLGYEAKFRAAVEQGLEDVRRGRTLSHEEVVARAKKRQAQILAAARKN